MNFKKLILNFSIISILVFSLANGAIAAPFRIAVVSPSTIDDSAWGQGMYDAMVSIQNEMGKKNFQFVYSESMFVISDAATAIRDYASQGYDLIIAHGVQYGSSLIEIAPDFPNTSFTWGSTTDTLSNQGIKNVFGYYVHAEEGSYILGNLAAKLSKSGIIGIIAPMEAGDVKLSVGGAKAGILAKRKDFQINANWTGSFSDVALASAAAKTHIEAGADIIMGAGQMSVGGIGLARKHGAIWFGLDSDQTPIAPDIVIGSQVYRWAEAIKPMIESINKGVRGGKAMHLNLANGGIEVVLNPLKAGDLKESVAKMRDDIIKGKIKIKIK